MEESNINDYITETLVFFQKVTNTQPEYNVFVNWL